LILPGALRQFEKIVQPLEDSDKYKENAVELLNLLVVFQDQNEQKLAGKNILQTGSFP
jgi:hypothetical protein